MRLAGDLLVDGKGAWCVHSRVPVGLQKSFRLGQHSSICIGLSLVPHSKKGVVGRLGDLRCFGTLVTSNVMGMLRGLLQFPQLGPFTIKGLRCGSCKWPLKPSGRLVS
jgi:hypothetical protein